MPNNNPDIEVGAININELTTTKGDKVINNKHVNTDSNASIDLTALGNTKKNNTVYSPLAIKPGDISQYESTLGEGLIRMTHGYDVLSDTRAANQSNWDQFGNAIVQMAGEMTGGILSGVGALLDIPRIIHNVADTDDTYRGNILTQLGDALQEGSKEIAPIYTSQAVAEGGLEHLFDKGYFWSHTSSIASAVSIMIPTMGAMKLLTGLGKLGKSVNLINKVKLVNKLNKAGKLGKSIKAAIEFTGTKSGQNVYNVITSSLLSRHMDNHMEASDLFEEKYKEYKSLGFSEYESRNAANDAFNFAYRKGYINLVSDIVQWGALFKYSNYANRAIGARMAQKMGKTKFRGMSLVGDDAIANLMADAPKYTLKSVGLDILKSGISEGTEEVIQEVLRSEGGRYSDKELGINTDDRDWGTRVADILTKPETQDAAFFGALGGMLFSIVGNGTVVKNSMKRANDYGKEIDAQLETIENITQKVGEVNKIRNAAKEFPYLHAQADIAEANMESEMVADGLSNGTLGITIEMLNNLSQQTNEQLKASGLAENTQSIYQSLADRLTSTSNKFNQYMNANYGYKEKDGAIALQLALTDHTIEQFKIIRDNLESEIQEAQNIPELLKTGHANKLYNAKVELSKRTFNIVQLKTRLEQLEQQKELLEAAYNNEPSAKIGIQLTAINNEIEEYTKQLINNGTIHEELSSEIEEIKKVLKDSKSETEYKEITELSSNDQYYIKEAYDKRVEIVNQQIENAESKKNKLHTKTGQAKVIEDYDKVIADLKDQKLKEYKEAINNAQTINELDNIYKKQVDKESSDKYKSIYEARKNVLEKEEAKAKEKAEYKTKIDTLANKIIKSGTDSLSEDEIEVYNNNKQTIDDTIAFKEAQKAKAEKEAKDKANQPVVPKEETTTKETNAPIETPKVETNTAITEFLELAEQFKDLFNITNEGISIKTLKETNLKPEQYVNDIALLVNNLLTYQNEQKKAGKTDTVTAIKTFLMQQLGVRAEEFKLENILPADIEIESKLAALYNRRISTYYNRAIEAGLITKEQVNSNTVNVKDTANTLKSIINEIKDITEADDNTQKSINFKKAAEKSRELTTRLIAHALKYHNIKNSNTPITINDIFNILIDGGLSEYLNNEFELIISVFDQLKLLTKKDTIDFSEKVDKVTVKGKVDLSTDFHEFRNILRDNNYLGIAQYINTRENELKFAKKVDNIYIHLANIRSISSESRVDGETLESLLTFLNLQIGEELSLEIVPEFNDSNLNNEQLAARNANGMSIPIKIVTKNGKEIGVIQSGISVHNGVSYTDNNGNINIFSENINEQEAELLSNYIRELYNVYADIKTGNNELDLTSLPEEIVNVLTKAITTNNDNAVINTESVRHVLEPLFYNKTSKTIYSLTKNAIIGAYNKHSVRFRNDLENTIYIRQQLEAGNKVALVVDNKTTAPDFRVRSDGNKSRRNPKDVLAPITINNETKITFGIRPGGESNTDITNLIDPDTGEVIKLEKFKLLDDKQYAILQKAAGIYQAVTLDKQMLGKSSTKFNRALIELVLTKLKEGNTYTSLFETFEDYIEYTKNDALPKEFNFKFNKFDTPTITLRTGVNRYAQIRYNKTKETFEYIESNTLQDGKVILPSKKNKDGKNTNPWVAITEKELAANKFNFIRRALPIDETGMFKNKSIHSIVDGKKYETIKEFLLETGALSTNLGVIRDKEGNPVTNFKFESEYDANTKKNKPVSALYVKVKTENKTNVDEPIKETKQEPISTDKFKEEVNNYIGKELADILELAVVKDYKDVLATIYEKLGIKVSISNETVNDPKSSTELTVAKLNNNEYIIKIHRQFIYNNNGTLKHESERNSILVHELLHPIIHSIRGTDKYDELTKSLNEYIISLEETLKGDNPLNDQERNVLINFINIAKKDIEEVITYAFSNAHVQIALAKLQGDQLKTKGFWSELIQIVKDAIGSIINAEGSKLEELTNLLNNHFNIETKTDSTVNTKVEEDVKIETKESITKPKGRDVLGKFFKNKKNPQESKDLTVLNQTTEQIYNKYKTSITNKYGLSKSEFVKYFNELTPSEQQQEIKCL